MAADGFTRRDVLKAGIASAALSSAPSTLVQSVASNELSIDAEHQSASEHETPSERQRFLLDFDWTFHLGNANDPRKDFGFGSGELFAKNDDFVAPGKPDFDDSSWEKINLPHDWAVALPFDEDKALMDTGFKPLGRRFPDTSIGWYRKVFQNPLPPGKRFRLEFEGVFRNCIVVLNNHYIGRNLSGYAPFSFDVSDFMNYGGQNTLVVRVDATEHEGWFYEGAGIYRHVWMVVTNPLHVAQWGTYLRSEVHGDSAIVFITAEIKNDSDAPQNCDITHTVFDNSGARVATTTPAAVTIGPWGRTEVSQSIAIAHPSLWSLEQPNLYRASTVVNSAGTTADRHDTSFGIRSVRFDPDSGFFLNDKPVKIKGTCNHQDHAGVGSALPDRLQYYRIERLKEMGSNGYRTSHNPPTPELLDACDRLGMLVMDETRFMSSSPEGLSQLERMIRRDRNHPCIVIWSLGNEEPDQGTERGVRMVSTMKRLAHKLDPSRPVTVAMNEHWGHGISYTVDVQGFNYGDGKGAQMADHIDAFHRRFPKKPTVGSETASDYATRGIYVTDARRGYVSAYDLNFPDYTLSAENWWTIYDERRFLAGAFAWTGFDYRGEPSPYAWPCISSQYGIIDTCGFRKDTFYYYQAWWGEKPVLHLFPHWNWNGKEGQEIQVWVYSNLERVELFLNGRSLGAKEIARNSHAMWSMTYAPGTIEARGFRGGRQVMVARRETTGIAERIIVHPDRERIHANGEDVSVVTAEVQDERGRLVPVADNEITFELTGPGRIIGVGNGNPSSHEPDKSNKRAAFNGLCVAIVQAGKHSGELNVRATSPGLAADTTTITCETAPLRPSL